MVALLRTTLSQRQNGVEAAYGTSESDVYPVVKATKRSSPKKAGEFVALRIAAGQLG